MSRSSFVINPIGKLCVALCVVLALFMNCREVVDEPEFEIPELPQIPEKYLISEVNATNGETNLTYEYQEGLLLRKNSSSVQNYTTYDYAEGLLLREKRTTYWNGSTRVGQTVYSHRTNEMEWIILGSDQLVTKTWTSPNTYEETITELDGEHTRTLQLTRYLIKDHKPISYVTCRLVNGEEEEVERGEYFYDQKVINPFFGRYGKDIFQSLWLYTRLAVHAKRQADGRWILVVDNYYEYELDEDAFPISYKFEHRTNDTYSGFSERKYLYR